MRKNKLFGVILGSFLLFLSAANAKDGEVYEFEKTAPAQWSVLGVGRLDISGLRFKTGEGGLQWRWVGKDAGLEIRGAEAIGEASVKTVRNRRMVSAVAMWVYNRSPLKDVLRIELIDEQGRIIGGSWLGLNYSGWRLLGARYDQLGWEEGEQVAAVRILAPSSRLRGELFFDHVCFNVFADGNWPRRDAQMPWVGLPDQAAGNPAALWTDPADPAQGRDWLPSQSSWRAQSAAQLAQLNREFPVRAVKPNGRGVATERVAQWRKKVRQDWGVARLGNGGIRGRAVSGGGFWHPQDAVSMKDALVLLRDLAQGWAQADANQESAIRELLIDLTAHLIDQGELAEGHGQLGWLGNGYDVRNSHFAGALFAASEPLAQAGLLEPTARGVMWRMLPDHLSKNPRASVDSWLNYTGHFFTALAALPDGAEKRHRAQIAAHYFDQTILAGNVLPTDGAVIHHNGFHLAYGSYGMPPMIDRVARLNRAGFAVSSQARRRLNRFAQTTAHVLVDDQLPPNLALRPGTSVRCNITGMVLALAQMGAVEGDDSIDREMAALYLALKAYDPDDAHAKRFREMGVVPANRDGFLPLPTAAGAVHRHGPWVVAMDGMNRFFRGGEVYAQDHCQGVYVSHGSVMTGRAGDGVSALGYAPKGGWNYALWPGATGLLRPAHELVVNKIPGYYGNASPIGGATSLDNGAGVWALNHRANGAAFRKTAFCIQDRITVVTSGIHSDVDRHAATTLFQQHDGQLSEPTIWLDETKLTGLDIDQQADLATAHWLTDAYDCGYYVHPVGDGSDGGRLHVTRRRQSWVCPEDRYLRNPQDKPDWPTRRTEAGMRLFEPRVGQFSAAWIDHGVKPSGQQMIYTQLLSADPKRMRAFALAMSQPTRAPIRLLQVDQAIHALHDSASNINAYAVFEPNQTLNAPGLLAAVARPCVVLIQGDGREDELHISMASTDTNDDSPFHLELAGAWRVDKTARDQGVVVETAKGRTHLEVAYQGNLPHQVHLVREK